MDNKKPFSKFQRKRPGMNVVLQEEEPEEQERSSGSESEESKNKRVMDAGSLYHQNLKLPLPKLPALKAYLLYCPHLSLVQRVLLEDLRGYRLDVLWPKPSALLLRNYGKTSIEYDNTDPQDDTDDPSIFVNVSIPLLLQTILKALNPQMVHATLPMELCNHILHLCTWIEVTIIDTPIRAVLDTGAPTNIISSRLVRRLGFLLVISYAESFFTAGVESIKYNGAYSSVPLRFGELVVTYPAVYWRVIHMICSLVQTSSGPTRLRLATYMDFSPS
ncbi:hypothetical protein DSO57_1008940 [Entomophthora muscae]|uniref:Uncharacterized protein n=1 Tax=Entomophthora muscae TaxID=34485 RepID=A0ACC2U4P0_9FUNG|nr:hypothetical protein DSO57_1008940 [Entomophthora muscae]